VIEEAQIPVKKEQFHAYGEGANQLFGWLNGSVKPPMEAIYEGVAGCGKSRLMGEWIKAMCNTYPQCKILVLRETRVSLNESFLDIWENEVLGPDHPAVINGPTREHRQSYKHPSLGGEVILGGFDNPTKLFSTQYNVIFFNECQETTLAKWESLHRALRRSGTPFRVLVGDCNPEDEYHWANQRCLQGKARRIVGRFWDNPKWYKHRGGTWTVDGIEYLNRLKNSLSGVRLQRLYYGKWVSAEGQVWENYDQHHHVIDGQMEKQNGEWFLVSPNLDKPVHIKWFLGAQDIGFDAPGVFQCWGVDSENRMYRLVEIYKRHWDHDQWAKAIVEVNQEFEMAAIVTDHDPAFISNLNRWLDRHGMTRIVREWDKHRGPGGEKAGIDQVRVRMKRRGDGTFGLYLLRNATKYKDVRLEGEGKPWCTEMEIPAYVYPLVEDGKLNRDTPDPGCIDHGCDAMRGACTFSWERDLGKEVEYKAKYDGGTLGHILDHEKWEVSNA
jgi:phage terminase large subunit